jgi:hypothetical protein
LFTRETDLYPPVRSFLESLGFTVRGEVKGCDVAAVRGDELVILELKLSFNASLLVQATDRQRLTDSVYVVLPFPKRGLRTREWQGITRVLKRLELGLLLVVDSNPARVEVAFHPCQYETHRMPARRAAVLREVRQRSLDLNDGGSNRRKLVTAYRESAIQAACLLEAFGPASPKLLRGRGASAKVGDILAHNFYGWFERIEKGVYALSERGRAELAQQGELVIRYLDEARRAAAGDHEGVNAVPRNKPQSREEG